MLINLKRPLFRVCAASDFDAALSLPAATIALLGITLGAGASGLVPYGPDAETVTRTIATPASFPGNVSITYARNAGPIDLPLARAVSLLAINYAGMVVGPDPMDGKPLWLAGSIAGETNIKQSDVLFQAGTGNLDWSWPNITAGLGAWLLD